MKYNTTIKQQRDYVDELREMWCKVARIHGYESPQEIAILDILCKEDDRLDELREMWRKVARIHGYESPQEIVILDVLCREDDRLDEMREKQNDDN